MNAPNPHWQSAPYEESGIGTMSMIATAISDAGHRCKAFTLIVRQSDHPNLFEFTLHELASTTPQVKVDATPKQA